MKPWRPLLWPLQRNALASLVHFVEVGMFMFYINKHAPFVHLKQASADIPLPLTDGRVYISEKFARTQSALTTLALVLLT